MAYKITEGSYWLPKWATLGSPGNFICYLRKGSELQGFSPQYAILRVSAWLSLEIFGIEELIIII